MLLRGCLPLLRAAAADGEADPAEVAYCHGEYEPSDFDPVDKYMT